MTSIFNPSILQHPLDYYAENYYQLLSELQKQGHHIYGYFTNKTPIELLHALQLVPIRILAAKHPQLRQGASERYIQTFSCSWLRRIIDIGLVEGYTALSGILFSTGTCDSLQNVSDIWQKVFPNQLTYNLTFPVQNTEAARVYLQNEFEQLIKFVQNQYPDQSADIPLAQSIKQYNQKRTLLRKVLSLVSERHISYCTFARYNYLSDILPIEMFIQEADKFLSTMSENNDSNQHLSELPRLLVVGGMWDNWHLFEIPEWDGLVADDLSFSVRSINYTLPVSDSLTDYSKSQLERIPEPTAYDMHQRLDGLEELIKHHQVDGVVLLTMKFCDPDAFELVPIRDRLKALNIPILSLETTSELSNLNQLRTRLAAFNELLS